MRLEFSRVAWKLLSRGIAGLRVARILRALSAGGGNRFDILPRAFGECRPALGENDAGDFPI